MRNGHLILLSILIGLSACELKEHRQESTTATPAKPLPPPTPLYSFEESTLYYRLPTTAQGAKDAKRFMADQGFPLSKMNLYTALADLTWAQADQQYRLFLEQNRQHQFRNLYRQYVSQIILKDLRLLAEADQKEKIAFYTNEMLESGAINPALLSYALQQLTNFWKNERINRIAKTALQQAADLKNELRAIKQSQLQDKSLDGLDELRTNLIQGANNELERIEKSEKAIAALIREDSDAR